MRSANRIEAGASNAKDRKRWRRLSPTSEIPLLWPPKNLRRMQWRQPRLCETSVAQRGPSPGKSRKPHEQRTARDRTTAAGVAASKSAQPPTMQLANGRPFTQTEEPTMNILTWFKRLLGIGPKGGSSTGAPAASSSSASEMLRRVLELQRVNANWETIFASLNPDRNQQVQLLINDLRGPHMFVPRVAIGPGLSVLTRMPRSLKSAAQLCAHRNLSISLTSDRVRSNRTFWNRTSRAKSHGR
jgi:hypothetical protein